MSPRGLAVGLAMLALTACGSDPAPAAEPAGPSPTAAPAATATPGQPPSPAPPPGPLLAVSRRSGGLELHAVDAATRQASLRRVLEPPEPGRRPFDVTLSAGPAPVVCASWVAYDEDVVDVEAGVLLQCYDDGDATGRTVSGPEQPAELALSADGTRLAWAELDSGGNAEIGWGALDGDRITSPRRALADAAQGPDGFTGYGVNALGWLEADRLALSTAVESDDGPALFLVDLMTAPAKGWLMAREVTPVLDDTYLTFDSVQPLDATSALAVQRGSFLGDVEVPMRAVQVDVVSGEVQRVVATAAEGRYVDRVSGTALATVYVTRTSPDSPVTTYLRLAQDSRGQVVEGLPADADLVMAAG